MPLRIKESTLKRLCVHEIIKNITNYTSSELDSIPIDILEDLILFSKYPNEWVWSPEKSLHISDVDKTRLIRQKISRLCLQFDPRLFLQWTLEQRLDLFNAVLKTSDSLTHFTFNATKIWTHNDFLRFVRSSPNIVFLKLTDAKFVNDDNLAAVGDNCLKLESLILERSEVTDKGIQRFCQSKSRGSKLKQLKFDEYTKVTSESCVIALQNLKQLKIFDCKHVIKAFMKLFHDLNEVQHPTFQLCELPQILMEKLPKGGLNFITKCCPNLSSLNLTMSENFENHVTEVKKCDVTLPLDIFFCNKFSMSSLTEMGSNVTSLFVGGGEIDVKLDAIGFACPNLKELKLSSVKYLPLDNLEITGNQIPFSKLRKFGVDSFMYNEIPITQLKFLLKYCLDLEELSLGTHYEINDDVIISVIHEINPLKCLTHFSISYCPGVSKVSIMELLSMENNLQCLRIKYSISAEEMNVIQSYIKENNYLVIIPDN